MLTITTERDTEDPECATVDALRERLGRVRRGMTGVVRVLRRYPGLVAAWGGVEISEAAAGHVHAHMLLATESDADLRYSDGEWVDLVWTDVLSDLGLGTIADCRRADPRGVAEVVKYATKTPSATTWQQEEREVVHPVIAARWEVACRGVRLRERWGAARSIAWDDPDDLPVGPAMVEDRLEARCPRCGTGDYVSLVIGRTAQILTWYSVNGVDPNR
ncbi:MAG: hypothetical protein GF393_04515, partial [Armatimonadia bacterium]|nr:hypothetical protein [Armatimonadia bacterium]